MRGSMQKQAFHFFRIIPRPHVPRIRYRYQVPRSYCYTKRVTPLDSSHGHRLATRAASARAAHGRCFDPKRASTAPGLRVCSASPEHRVGSLLIAGQDQTQAHSSSSTRGSSTTPDDGSHIHRIVRPRCRTESSWLRAGRVWACTRPLQSVQQLNWCATDELSFSCLHEYCCCGTCYTSIDYLVLLYTW